jgi:peroxiredoxin
LGSRYPTYLSGTSTQPLHRGHFAVTRPVGASTLTIALRMTTSSGLRTRMVTRQIGQRPRSCVIWMADVCRTSKYLLSIGIVKNNVVVDKRLQKEGFMSLRLGDTAPDFSAESTQGPIRFHDWAGESWTILFSHPRDFTPVCTTELGYVARLKPEFDRRGVKAIGLSIDPVDAHAKWSEDIRATQGQAPNFPIVADPDRKVANLYGMMQRTTRSTRCARSSSSIPRRRSG